MSKVPNEIKFCSKIEVSALHNHTEVFICAVILNCNAFFRRMEDLEGKTSKPSETIAGLLSNYDELSIFPNQVGLESIFISELAFDNSRTLAHEDFRIDKGK
ncbi:hypothetical protein NPIL_36761 [Nephila pilipes]|uniref:Uncharacterized protein n=1 Tax=Nephila pilipes TaxID=299642 RepID=A0A8X6NVK1_NEPPI|nr:hypothetical protein NPIL_36761 [Nephila pilipes]